MSSTYVFYAWASEERIHVYQCTEIPLYTLSVEEKSRYSDNIFLRTLRTYIGFRTLAEATAYATHLLSNAREEPRMYDLVRVAVSGPWCRMASKVAPYHHLDYAVLYGRE